MKKSCGLLASYLKILVAIDLIQNMTAERIAGLANLTSSIARNKLDELLQYGLVTQGGGRYTLTGPCRSFMKGLTNLPVIKLDCIHPATLALLHEIMDYLKEGPLTVVELGEKMNRRQGYIRDLLLILNKLGIVKEVYMLGVLKWMLV